MNTAMGRWGAMAGVGVHPDVVGVVEVSAAMSHYR